MFVNILYINNTDTKVVLGIPGQWNKAKKISSTWKERNQTAFFTAAMIVCVKKEISKQLRKWIRSQIWGHYTKRNVVSHSNNNKRK